MMTRARRMIGITGLVALLTACGGGTVSYEDGAATAVLELAGGDPVTFDDGTCEAGDGIFIANVGEGGYQGEGVGIRLGSVEPDGGSVDGNPAGHGVQVDHGGHRWGMADGPDALVFESQGTGATVQLQGLELDGETPDPAVLTLTCV